MVRAVWRKSRIPCAPADGMGWLRNGARIPRSRYRTSAWLDSRPVRPGRFQGQGRRSPTSASARRVGRSRGRSAHPKARVRTRLGGLKRWATGKLPRLRSRCPWRTPRVCAHDPPRVGRDRPHIVGLRPHGTAVTGHASAPPAGKAFPRSAGARRRLPAREFPRRSPGRKADIGLLEVEPRIAPRPRTRCAFPSGPYGPSRQGRSYVGLGSVSRDKWGRSHPPP